ncbi:MAG: hypothetical protein ACJAYC_002746 [Halieaceae bacterium]|jgi:hypothetical protein
MSGKIFLEGRLYANQELVGILNHCRAQIAKDRIAGRLPSGHKRGRRLTFTPEDLLKMVEYYGGAAAAAQVEFIPPAGTKSNLKAS